MGSSRLTCRKSQNQGETPGVWPLPPSLHFCLPGSCGRGALLCVEYKMHTLSACAAPRREVIDGFHPPIGAVARPRGPPEDHVFIPICCCFSSISGNSWNHLRACGINYESSWETHVCPSGGLAPQETSESFGAMLCEGRRPGGGRT